MAPPLSFSSKRPPIRAFSALFGTLSLSCSKATHSLETRPQAKGRATGGRWRGARRRRTCQAFWLFDRFSIEERKLLFHKRGCNWPLPQAVLLRERQIHVTGRFVEARWGGGRGFFFDRFASRRLKGGGERERKRGEKWCDGDEPSHFPSLPRVGQTRRNRMASLPDPLRVFADLLLLATRADVPWSAQAVSNARRWAELAEKKRRRKGGEADVDAATGALPAALSASLRDPPSCSSAATTTSSLDALLLEALAGALPLPDEEENSSSRERTEGVPSSSVAVERGEARARALSALASSAAAAAGARPSRRSLSSSSCFSSASSSSSSAVDDLLDSLLVADLAKRKANGGAVGVAAATAAAPFAAAALHALCEREGGGEAGTAAVSAAAPPPPRLLPAPGELAAASDALAYLCDPGTMQRAAAAALLLEAGRLPEAWSGRGGGEPAAGGGAPAASSSSEANWPAEARCLAAAHPLWARSVSRAARALSAAAPATEGGENGGGGGGGGENGESERGPLPLLLPSSPGPVVLRLPPALVAAAASAEPAFALGAAEVAAAVVVRSGLGRSVSEKKKNDDGDDEEHLACPSSSASFDAPRAAAKLLVHMLALGEGTAARAARRALAAAAVTGARPPPPPKFF